MNYVQQKLAQGVAAQLREAIGDRDPNQIQRLFNLYHLQSAAVLQLMCEHAICDVTNASIRFKNIEWLRSQAWQHYDGCQWVLDNAGL